VATFGVKGASDEPFCPSTLDLPEKYFDSKGLCERL